MRQDCRPPRSALGAGPSANLTASALSATRPRRCDAAARHGATKSAVPLCILAAVAGTVVVAATDPAPTDRRSLVTTPRSRRSPVGEAGTSTKDGTRAPSASLNILATSAPAIAKCTAVTTTGTSWTAPPIPSCLGGVESLMHEPRNSPCKRLEGRNTCLGVLVDPKSRSRHRSECWLASLE